MHCSKKKFAKRCSNMRKLAGAFFFCLRVLITWKSGVRGRQRTQQRESCSIEGQGIWIPPTSPLGQTCSK